MIFDEAHLLTNPETGFWKITKMFQIDVEDRDVTTLLATGTPLKNSTADLAVLTGIMDHKMNSLGSFVAKYHVV